MDQRRSRKRSSVVWDNFTETVPGKQAKCNHCFNKFSFAAGTTSNLSRHLKNRHPTIHTARQDPVASIPEENVVDDPDPQPSTSHQTDGEVASELRNETLTSTRTSTGQNSRCNPSSRQPLISSALRAPLTLKKQQALDKQLTKMIVRGYQPFSIVEEEEFRKFVAMLNPSYSLPDRKTISTNFIPKYYEECKAEVQRDLENETVAVTTDSWTSVSNDNYLSLTAHYLTQESELKTALLSCVEVPENHTADNLKDKIEEVLNEWGLKDRVLAASADNAANIKAAIERGNWKYVPCSAHTLNLTVKAAVKKNLKQVKKKVKSIVRHFKSSPTAEAKLKRFQEQMNAPQLKLKQSVKTRWNSEYDMFQRILAIKEPVIACLAILNSGLEIPTEEEWTALEESCKILECFDELSKRLGSETQVTLSELNIMLSGVRTFLAARYNSEDLPQTVRDLVKDLMDDMRTRFGGSTATDLYDECTLLDPRFKKQGFSSDFGYQSTYQRLRQKLRAIPGPTVDKGITTPALEKNETPMKPSILFGAFDKKVENLLAKQSAPEAHIVELDKFLKEDLLPRNVDPLLWWRNNRHLYPRLFQFVRRRLCIPATSVPSERVFSKCGQTITLRRNCLKPSKASMLVFLNMNWR